MRNRPGETQSNGKKAVWVAITLLLFITVAFTSTFQAAPQQRSQAQIEAGRKLFAGSCSNSYCHGSAGTGGGGPKLKDRDFSVEHLTRVIVEGVPGTTMPGFKSRYTQDQIAQIVAYVLSLSPNNPNLKARQRDSATQEHVLDPKAETGNVKSSNDSSELRGDAASGRDIFFDSAQIQNCRVCHTIREIGGRVGPDLTKIAERPAREILRSIIAPSESINSNYATIELTTHDGSRYLGVKRDENEKMIRLYDTSTLPPVSRAFLKSEVTKIEKLDKSAMPGDYRSRYSNKQLLDLVSFIKSADPAKPVSLSLKDLF
jgi:putative heme-binding domain-containing protein